MTADWHAMFVPTTPLLEIVLRGTLMYLALFVLLRIVPARQVGAVSTADLLVVVLIADVSQNAFSADYKSLTEGLILAGTIVFWNYAIDLAGFKWRAFERLVEEPRLTLVEDGEILWDNMGKERITHAELMSQLRQQGVESPAEVKLASLEPNGRISVISREGRPSGAPPSDRQAV